MRAPAPLGPDWKSWAEGLVRYLDRFSSFLRYKLAEDSAAEDGVLLWDPSTNEVVVSTGGAFKPLYRIPDQTGQTGKVLKTDGSSLYWDTP